MKVLTFMVAVFLLTAFQVNAEVFEYKQGDIQFDIGTLKYNEKNSRQDPLSLVFQAGKPPFSASVQFKIESESQSLDDFIKVEELKHKESGYSDDVSYSVKKTGKFNSVEYLRESPLGVIHWFVFQKASSKKIYSFWFVEGKSLTAETKEALSAYSKMKSTLK